MENNEILNSREYWDKRFEGDWAENEGASQTIFFTNIALSIMPKAFKDLIKNLKLSILDWGCAEGDGLNELNEYFPESKMMGLDFSLIAINKAKKKYSQLIFFDGNLSDLECKFDIIFSSNCLEHFTEPKKILNEYFKNARSYVVLLLPFQEFELHKEHFTSFDYNSFDIYSNNFFLIHYDIVDTLNLKNSYWPGRQILVIYARRDALGLEQLNLTLHDEVNILEQKKVDKLQNDLIESKQECKILIENSNKIQEKIYNLESCISFMQSSKFWKLRNNYIKIVNEFNLKLVIDIFKPLVPLQLRRKFGPIYNNFFLVRKITGFSLSKIDKINKIDKKYFYDIFNFSIIDWDFRTQRPQHLCREMVKRNNRVFYVATTFIATNKSGLNYDDIAEKIQVREIEKNIFEICLVAKNNLNIYKDIINDSEDFLYLKYSVDAIKERFNVSYSISIVDLPFWSELVYRIDDTKVIYDCMDDHGGFENNEKAMLEEEDKLFSSCDLLLTSSNVLNERGIKKNKNVLMVKNACEFDKFSELKNVGKLGEYKGNIVGYYGAIAEWFDFELIRHCAENLPEVTFVLIGNVSDKSKITEFKDLINVHFLGEKPYGEIHQYLASFDACLIPFRVIPLTLATNPVKFFEYISSGKSVVSVKLPELLEYSDIAFIASNKDEFLSGIRTALKEKLDINDELIEKRIKVAKNNTWEKRSDVIWEGINELLYPKVSIIVVTYNNIDYTKKCLESIFLYTKYPNYELIIVDNDSTDGTKEFLLEEEKKNINIRVILNAENSGFAGGNNIGLKIASGKYIVLLNNDTIVTDNWLAMLKKFLDENSDLGMIGPVSNSVGNIQMIPVKYKHVDDMQKWAKYYTDNKANIYNEIEMVGFFCVMMRREVHEKVGFLDENFGVGMFEDDDYCMRVNDVGYKIGYTKKVFVHHFGSVSFQKMDNEIFRKNWEKNKAYFEKKWNKTWKSTTN